MSDLGFERMTHSKVPLPKPTVHAGHPYNNAKNHEKLLTYLQERLLVGKAQRDGDIPRLVRVDKKVSGWLKLSHQDKIRHRQSENEGNPLMTKINLPLSFVHLDDIMTYFAGTFAPNRGMFYHTGSPEETSDASQVTAKMNNDAIQSGYYRELLLGLFALLKYNQGGYFCNWSQEQGPKLVQTDINLPPEVEMQVRWAGNRVEAVDNYNILRDPSVRPEKLHCDGEFVAHAKLRSHYWLQQKASEGFFFNVRDTLDKNDEMSELRYYKHPPSEAQFTTTEDGADSGTDWLSVLSESAGYIRATGYELVTIYIRLNPTEFGLVPGGPSRLIRNRYEIWRFTILNDTTIIDATQMNNIHGYLPCFLGTMNDDVMGQAQKSVAEILTPLQDFASHLLNTHVEASRARLYGTTIYDPTMVKLDNIPRGEVAARLPVNPSAYGKDVRTFIWQMNSDMDTERTLQDLEAVMGLVNQFFPTQSLPSQIASIDRAVDSQVAAVQQGANRRQQKAARLLDATLFTNIRFTMYYNIIQYATDNEEIVDAYTGKSIRLNVGNLRNSNLPYIIGQGLKAIDRMAAASSLQNIIFALIQSPQAGAQFDIAGLIDYWTSMIDIDMDMKQFRVQPPPPAQPPGQGGEVDPATGQPVSPMTQPAALTAPLRA